MVESPMPKVSGKEVPPGIPLEKWKKWTYTQYYDECRVAARAMIHLGLQPFDGVNVFGFNSPEWLMGELAAIMAGGVAAGIYPTDMPDQVVYKSKHSSSSIAIVENEAKLKVFLDNKAELPKLKAVIVWAPEDESKIQDAQGVKVVTWTKLSELAKNVTDDELDKRIAAQQPGNVCAYIYTSGTTGNPKAVMISHDNIIYSSTCTLFHLKFLSESKGMQERVLSFLPLSHVAGMMMDIVIPLVLSAKRPGYMSVCFARPYDMKMGSLGDRLRTVKPTVFLGVPRVWEKISEKLKAVGATTTGLKKTIATWAKSKGLEHAYNCQMGGSGAYPPFYSVANKLVLSKVKAALGLDECKFGFTGAAPISTETLEYFGQLGIQINEVYGMSECTGATSASTDAAHVWGSCGWATAGVELKIFKEGGGWGGLNVEAPFAKDLKVCLVSACLCVCVCVCVCVLHVAR
jgi:long-chain-fatty-acid--CoA ligase ACSBG